jgi:GTP-binding protein
MFRIAIVGRPNVGKSTLFNRLCGSRKAIVGDEPGITRDRIFGAMKWCGKSIEVLDTGGMIPGSRDVIPGKILQQVEQACAESNLLLLVVDGRAGVTSADESLLPMLRKTGRPIWVVVNKIDAPDHEIYAGPFYFLGCADVFPISAEHNRGIEGLLDAIVDRFGGRLKNADEPAAGDDSREIAVAVVGRPNVGKSSLVNRLLGSQRAIVSEIPGTTRDSVDSLLERDGMHYRIIDTAGIRRKGRTDQRTEKISVIMARKNLEHADVALMLLDAEEGVTKLDAAIAGYASEAGCSVIIVLNKWDKIRKDQNTLLEQTDSIHRRMKYLGYAPIIAVSALTGQRVSKLFEMIQKAFEARTLRIPTGELNRIFVPEAAEKFTVHDTSQQLDILYVTQAGTSPPTFVVFVAGRKPLHFSTERFLVNQLRERFGFYATPVLIRQRLKKTQGKFTGKFQARKGQV